MAQKSTISISVEQPPRFSDITFILNSLRDFNNKITNTYNNKDVGLFLRDSKNKIRGGIHARVSWGLLDIKYLWIEDSLRGRGFGTKLLQRAESYAKAQRCKGVFLDIFSFQAPGFYEKRGYKVFGVLDGFKGGYRRYYLKKNF